MTRTQAPSNPKRVPAAPANLPSSPKGSAAVSALTINNYPSKPLGDAFTSAPTSGSGSSFNIDPGPHRFRGDVPAFNTCNLLPQLYSQQMHQHAPPPSELLPIYPNQHLQYFTQQLQFIPYGSQMMPMYPVVMGYPDYLMYQAYQYCTMPAGQFQNPLAYMAMNGMAHGIGHGCEPNRKKHFKTHHNHNCKYNYNNHNGHYNNNHHHISNTYNASQSGGSQYSQLKHASTSTHSQNGPAESVDSTNLRSAEPTKTELVSYTDNPSYSPGAHETLSKISNNATDVCTQPTDHALNKAPHKEHGELQKAKEVSSLRVSRSKNDTSSHEQELSHQSMRNKVPLFFNTSLDELRQNKRSTPELLNKLLELKRTRIKQLVDTDLNRNYHVDTRRTFHIINHENGSKISKELRVDLPKYSTHTNDNDTYNSNASKQALNWASLLQSTIKKPQMLKTPTLSNGTLVWTPPTSSPSAVPTLPDGYQSLGVLVISMLYDPAFDLNSYESFLLSPRGLTNAGNICYMNAVLQCLIFCGPFNKILRLIGEKSLGFLGEVSSTPVLDAIIDFMTDFSNTGSMPNPNRSSVNSDGIIVGRPLSPEKLFMGLIESPKFQHLKWGQQEDAEEFLVYLLDGLHEDFVKAEATVSTQQMGHLASLFGEKLDGIHAEDLIAKMKYGARLVHNTGNISSENPHESDAETTGSAWSEAGSGRKVSSKRVSEIEPSPITRIFGGRFRSVLDIPMSKESYSITVDPYRSILLDISLEKVDTIEDALWQLNEVEKLPYKNEDGVEVVAQKQTYIEELPEVLTLQLKRFSFQQKYETSLASGTSSPSHFHAVGTIEKVLKNVSYGLELIVPLETVSPATRNAQKRRYMLTGVIYHHGPNAEGGHYTCDVLRGGNKWLRIDDTAVEAIDANAVTEKPETKDKSAYIFIYQRKQGLN